MDALLCLLFRNVILYWLFSMAINPYIGNFIAQNTYFFNINVFHFFEEVQRWLANLQS